MRRLVLLVLLVVLAVALPAPAAARADLLSEYQALAERELSPAPLVPTTAPKAIGRIDRAVQGHGNRRRSGYGLRLVHYDDSGPDAVVALEGGTWKGMRGALRELRRSGFSTRTTRVRGHRGYVLSQARQRSLLWREGGVVYWIGTGTPDKVSVRGLRATAAGLERLGGAFAGVGGDPDLGGGAVLVTTATTVTAFVEWGARCFAADGSEASASAGSQRITLLRRDGAAFATELDSRGWTGTVSGTVREGAVDVSLRATITVDGATCDTGPVAFTARPIEPF